MEDQSFDKLEAKVRHYAEENEKLKKSNQWLGAFVVMVVIIQVYIMVSRYLE